MTSSLPTRQSLSEKVSALQASFDSSPYKDQLSGQFKIAQQYADNVDKAVDEYDEVANELCEVKQQISEAKQQLEDKDLEIERQKKTIAEMKYLEIKELKRINAELVMEQVARKRDSKN